MTVTPYRLEWNVEKYCFKTPFPRDQSALPWAEQPCPTLCGDSTIKPSRPIDMGHVRILLAVLSFWKSTTVEC